MAASTGIQNLRRVTKLVEPKLYARIIRLALNHNCVFFYDIEKSKMCWMEITREPSKHSLR